MCRSLVLILSVLVCGGPAAVEARAENVEETQVADLKEQLESGLKARLDREFAFIDKVVTYVEQGKLPLSLVRGTFQWARKKAGNRKYPFPYFENAMKIRAARIGVTL